MMISLNIVPIRLRLFGHYLKFIYNLFINNKAIELLGFFNKRYNPLSTRSNSEFHIQYYALNIGQYSFVSIATKLLNDFLYAMIC